MRLRSDVQSCLGFRLSRSLQLDTALFKPRICAVRSHPRLMVGGLAGRMRSVVGKVIGIFIRRSIRLPTEAQSPLHLPWHARCYDDLGQTWYAEDKKATSHFSACPEEKRTNQVHGVSHSGKIDRTGKAQACCNGRATCWLAWTRNLGDWGYSKTGTETYSIPTPKIIEIPIFFCQFICNLQMILCGSRNMAMSETTCTLAEVSITEGSE